MQIGRCGRSLDHRDIGKPPKRHRTHEGAAFREAEDVLDLTAAEVGADLVGDRSNALAGEEDVGELSQLGSWMVTTSPG